MAAPVVSLQPTAQTAAGGATATFTAAASGSPTVQWQVALDGVNWANITSATSTTYARTNCQDVDAGLFRAVFTNSDGTATTNAVGLSVTHVLPAGSLVYELNRLAGTSGLDAAGAASAWAGVTGEDLVGALNLKAGTWGINLDGIANLLAGTQSLAAPAALASITSGSPSWDSLSARTWDSLKVWSNP